MLSKNVFSKFSIPWDIPCSLKSIPKNIRMQGLIYTVGEGCRGCAAPLR